MYTLSTDEYTQELNIERSATMTDFKARGEHAEGSLGVISQCLGQLLQVRAIATISRHGVWTNLRVMHVDFRGLVGCF